jgi:peptidoglycan-N-acetylglucosamine deacetylase
MANPALIGSCGAGLLAAGGFLSYAVRGRSASIFGKSVYRGSSTESSIALTFDDGPSESTPQLLELLEKFGVRATFFMCGQNVARLPEIARQVADAGHEIGNHSDSHPRLDFCSREFIYRELAEAQTKIARHAGVTPKLFRAPYGVRWFGVGEAQERLGLQGVMWTIIGHDWRWPGPRIAQLLTTRSQNGAIICLHDGRLTQVGPDISPTLEAVAEAIPALQQRGFQFKTVSELLCPPNPSPQLPAQQTESRAI